MSVLLPGGLGTTILTIRSSPDEARWGDSAKSAATDNSLNECQSVIVNAPFASEVAQAHRS
jgi:hypothetical protein